MYLARISCDGPCPAGLAEAMQSMVVDATTATVCITVFAVVAFRVYSLSGFGGVSKECETEG